MTSRKREAVWCLAITAGSLIGASVLIVLSHPVPAVCLAFLAGAVAMGGLLDWID